MRIILSALLLASLVAVGCCRCRDRCCPCKAPEGDCCKCPQKAKGDQPK